MRKRISPEIIESLNPNEIFVFGSNLGGYHGAGAAWTAYHKFGAIYHQGEGIQGQSYAIPTKDMKLRVIPLPIIQVFVDNFIQYAIDHPDKRFLVTAIGCGLANYSYEEIAPLFKAAMSVKNIYLPLKFIQINKS